MPKQEPKMEKVTKKELSSSLQLNRDKKGTFVAEKLPLTARRAISSVTLTHCSIKISVQFSSATGMYKLQYQLFHISMLYQYEQYQDVLPIYYSTSSQNGTGADETKQLVVDNQFSAQLVVTNQLFRLIQLLAEKKSTIARITGQTGTSLGCTAPAYGLLYCSTIPRWNRLLLGNPMVCDTCR